MLLFLINAVFRGAGDAASPCARSARATREPRSWTLPDLRAGAVPGVGITGAASPRPWGTVGVLYQFLALGRDSGPGAQRAAPAFDLSLAPRAASLGWDGAVLIGTASWLGLVRILSVRLRRPGRLHDRHPHHHLRDTAVVWSQQRGRDARGPELGARQPDRAENAVWIAGLYNMVFLGVVGLVLLVKPFNRIPVRSRRVASSATMVRLVAKDGIRSLVPL